jgi:hypothetical protein
MPRRVLSILSLLSVVATSSIALAQEAPPP